MKPRCTWITGMGSAGKNTRCNKTATYKNAFGWDYYYCEYHAKHIQTVENGINGGSIEPISRFRRFIQRIIKLIGGDNE